MSNTPNFHRASTLAEFVDRRRREASIEIPMPDDGPPIVIPPAEFWSAEIREAQRKLRTGKSKPVEVARLVLGADFDRFAANVEAVVPGMDPGDFFWLYLQEETTRKQGATQGE